MYERYCRLRDNSGLRDADVATRLGFAKSTLSDRKRGKDELLPLIHPLRARLKNEEAQGGGNSVQQV